MREAGEAPSGPVAVVEIGSGSVKLLVADPDGVTGEAAPLSRLSVKTRLAAGGGARPSDEAIAATRAALGRFAEEIQRHGVVTTTAVATAIGRTGVDLAAVEADCQALLGVPLEVLSGDREAALGFAGAVAGRSVTGPVALIDIGSASTEFAIGEASNGDDPQPGSKPSTWSLPIGARSVTEGYLHGDPPDPGELSSALSVAELHYDDLRRELPDLGEVLDRGTLFGVGAIAQIAAVEIGLADPADSVDGYRLTKEAAEEVFRTLATEDREDRAFNPGLLIDHVDDIVGGLCILVEFLRRFGVDALVVSERDLRYGLAAEMLADR
jgi:exopolyphosphatase/guanosine-5'-triphosphate,3'-diphosphate pyrophosphatase